MPVSPANSGSWDRRSSGQTGYLDKQNQRALDAARESVSINAVKSDWGRHFWLSQTGTHVLCAHLNTCLHYIQVQHNTPFLPHPLPDTHRGSENSWLVRLLCWTEGQPVKDSSHPHLEHSFLENGFRPSASRCFLSESRATGVHSALVQGVGGDQLGTDFSQWIPLPPSREQRVFREAFLQLQLVAVRPHLGASARGTMGMRRQHSGSIRLWWNTKQGGAGTHLCFVHNWGADQDAGSGRGVDLIAQSQC